MSITIRNADLKTEADFREALIKAQNELRIFRSKSRPELRTPELWERFYQLQAQAVWLEDSLATMRRSKERQIRKKLPAKKTVWESVKRHRDEEEEE